MSAEDGQEKGSQENSRRICHGTDAREYRGTENGGGWRRWAKAHILSHPQVPKSAWGPRFNNMMAEGSEAQRSLKNVNLEDLSAENGYEIIFNILDDQFPEEDVSAEVKRSLKQVREFDAKDEENTRELVGRFRNTMREANANKIRHSQTAL
jgi:hypothetical protein